MISRTTYIVALSILVFYVFSIVFGRLYTGMHSFTDCLFGIILGTSIWAVHILAEPILDVWVRESGWIGELLFSAMKGLGTERGREKERKT